MTSLNQLNPAAMFQNLYLTSMFCFFNRNRPYFRQKKNIYKNPLFQDNGTRSAKMLTLKFWPTKIWHPCSNLYTVIKEKKKKLSELESLRQPASADFLVFSTYFLGDFWVFSTFCSINLKQHVEKTQKSAKAGCLKCLSSLNFRFFQHC